MTMGSVTPLMVIVWDMKSYELRVASYELRVASYELRVASLKWASILSDNW